MGFYKAAQIEEKFAPLSFDEAILLALNSHEKQEDQAAMLEVSTRTLSRWTKGRFVEKCKCSWELVKPSVLSIEANKQKDSMELA